MKELPANIKKAINKYEPITVDGITLYPVIVEDYTEFLIGRSAIEFMQQSLPIDYISLPLLQAYYSLDFEASIKGETPTGLFSRALLMLVLSLRLGDRGMTIPDRIKQFDVVVDKDDPTKLKAIRYTKDNAVHDISPTLFQRLRPIIAGQNGITLEKDTANPELVEAEREIDSQKAPDLEVGIEYLISSVSALTGTDESDIYQWAILKLNRRADSFKRIIDYMTCAVAEMNGTSWRGGNPVPNPWFSKIRKGSSALMAMDKFASGAGTRAMNNPGLQVT